MTDLEHIIKINPEWVAQCLVFITDNPEFLPYRDKIPLCRWSVNEGRNPFETPDKYTPSNINQFMIKYLCKKYMNIEGTRADGYKNVPSLINKINDLPVMRTYTDFDTIISDLIEPEYFFPELSNMEVFNLYNEVEVNYNDDINCFHIYGLYNKDRELDNPALLDMWTREKRFVEGLSKVYNHEFTNGYEALKFVQKWKRFQSVGYVLCMI
jgi:hypothetical protein